MESDGTRAFHPSAIPSIECLGHRSAHKATEIGRSHRELVVHREELADATKCGAYPIKFFNTPGWIRHGKRSPAEARADLTWRMRTAVSIPLGEHNLPGWAGVISQDMITTDIDPWAVASVREVLDAIPSTATVNNGPNGGG